MIVSTTVLPVPVKRRGKCEGATTNKLTLSTRTPTSKTADDDTDTDRYILPY